MPLSPDPGTPLKRAVDPEKHAWGLPQVTAAALPIPQSGIIFPVRPNAVECVPECRSKGEGPADRAALRGDSSRYRRHVSERLQMELNATSDESAASPGGRLVRPVLAGKTGGGGKIFRESAVLIMLTALVFGCTGRAIDTELPLFHPANPQAVESVYRPPPDVFGQSRAERITETDRGMKMQMPAGHSDSTGKAHSSHGAEPLPSHSGHDTRETGHSGKTHTDHGQ